MKTTKQTKQMESKLLPKATSKPFKTIGSGKKKPEKKVKVLSESLPKISSKMHDLVRNMHAGNLDVEDPLQLGLAMSLVSLNAVYPFRLAQLVTVGSDASGNAAFSFPVDPSSSGENFAEYSTITTLFNQVRVRSFQCTFAPMYLNASSDAPPFCVAGSLTTLGVPTSYTSVVENADSQLYPWQAWRIKPYKHAIKFSPKPVWADITTPDPGDNIGTPGCIIGYAAGLPASVTNVLKVMIVGIYEFRSRT